MNLTLVAIAISVSYLIGSISFARLIARLVDPNLDLEKVRMPSPPGTDGQPLRTIGATTASIQLGPKIGCTIGTLDILKGVVPVLIFKLLFPEQYYHLIAACFVVIGHDWSIFYRFRGGGGISPTYGGFFVVDLFGTIISAFAGLILGFFIIRDILVAYMSGLWFMLVWLIVFKSDAPHVLYGIAMNIIFTLALIPEVKQHLERRRQGNMDMGESLDKFPMGRGMLRIMHFFGVKPR